MGFSDSIFLTPEKKPPQIHHNSPKKPAESIPSSPENERSVPRSEDDRKDEDKVDGGEVKLMPASEVEFTTPTDSALKKSLVCPPAPKKPKSVLMSSCRKRIFLDFASTVESLFPASVQADFGKKIKKAKMN